MCNRLNLLLIDGAARTRLLPARSSRCSSGRGSAPRLPPHPHPLGHEWALDDGNEATVTVAPVDGPRDAARARQRPRPPGWRRRSSPRTRRAAEAFLGAYAGTGAFWNATTRLLDGFKLLGAPETGINVDHVPGPRGPVTYRDLHLRQYVVAPRGLVTGLRRARVAAIVPRPAPPARPPDDETPLTITSPDAPRWRALPHGGGSV